MPEKEETIAQKMFKEIKTLKRTITAEELSKHNNEESMWVAVHGKVFDLTDFYMEHPGGWDVIEKAGGSDGTELFEDGDQHTKASVRDMLKYYIGEFQGTKEHKPIKRPEYNFQKELTHFVLGLIAFVAVCCLLVYPMFPGMRDVKKEVTADI